MGADIAGACGQLVVDQEKKQQQHKLIDIEDGLFPDDGRGRRSVTSFSKRGKNEMKTKEETEYPLIRQLALASAVAASCFVVSSALLLLQKRNR